MVFVYFENFYEQRMVSLPNQSLACVVGVNQFKVNTSKSVFTKEMCALWRLGTISAQSAIATYRVVLVLIVAASFLEDNPVKIQ